MCGLFRGVSLCERGYEARFVGRDFEDFPDIRGHSDVLPFCWLAFGDFIARYVLAYVKYIGMGLLLFVGGSMIKEAFSEEESQNLSGLRNIVIAGVADSIDALAVGISMSMAGRGLHGMTVPLAAVFLITALSVVLGIKGGHVIGRRAGKPASIVGGCVLILLGLNIVFEIV